MAATFRRRKLLASEAALCLFVIALVIGAGVEEEYVFSHHLRLKYWFVILLMCDVRL
jgi:hypothetical protein